MVFLLISDPVGASFVVSRARPGGHATGFADAPASTGGDWLRLLKEIAPSTNRVAVMVGTGTAPGGGSYYLRVIEAAARAVEVNVITFQVKNAGEIEQDVREFASRAPGALIVTPDMTTTFGPTAR
jgi:putative tryptophan/tyrosine transport system substrate-binding protein